MTVRILIHAFFSHVRKYIVIKVLAVIRHSFDTEIGSANLNADLVWNKMGPILWIQLEREHQFFSATKFKYLFYVPNFKKFIIFILLFFNFERLLFYKISKNFREYELLRAISLNVYIINRNYILYVTLCTKINKKIEKII